MIWVGSFKSLQAILPKLRFTDDPLEVHTWVRSEIGLISPLVDWLMSLIVGSRCVFGEDQGHGFDPNKVPDPLAVENLNAEHGRGIHLMKIAMDEVSFEREGTEVHMRKASDRKQETPTWRPQDRVTRRLVTRPSPGVRVVELPLRHSHTPSQTCRINGD